MAQTLTEKIAQAHMTDGPSRPLRAGDVVSLRPRHVMTHDNTAAVMAKFAGLGAERILDPRQPVWPMDHDVQNRSEKNLAKYRAIEAFARGQGVDFHPPGTGIGHQIMVSEGYVVPGALVVASDSHANIYGALGALGTPIVRTDAAVVWATGEFWWQVPESVQVVLNGRLRDGVTGKDLIVTLCGLYNRGEVLNMAVEFAGDGVAGLPVDARMTVANMTTEWGALAGIFPADDVTLDWLEGRRRALEKRGVGRIRSEDLDSWRRRSPSPDPDAPYAVRIEVDLDRVSPHVSGPDSVQVMRPLAEVSRERVPVNKAYLLSCVNSRLEDLEAAARVVQGRRIAPSVDFLVAAASAEIQREAERTGAWGTLVGAGARTLPPGCGPCIGLGEGLLEAGEVGISATNRNFRGRMGAREATTYLASPEVVAESAVRGYIAGPVDGDGSLPERRIERRDRRATGERVEIVEGFPARLEGRAVIVPRDNLNTDGIYGKDYTYREDMPPEAMARVVMHNYDPALAARLRPGDILVGGFNFGTGSSREQAATALKAAGVSMVVAGSFSQTYLRNAFNNGFLCVACTDLVDWMRVRHPSDDPSIIPGGSMSVDFASGTIEWSGKRFRFTPLGTVPQMLIAAGGIENRVRARLAGAERAESNHSKTKRS